MARTPTDVLIGRELARQLNADPAGRIDKFKFTYDVYVEFEDMPTDTQVWISPNTLTRNREARSIWSKNCSLSLVLIVGQGMNQDEQFLDGWIYDFDLMMDKIEAMTPLDNHLIESVQEERYDRDLLHSHKRLAMTTELLYNVISQ